MDANLISSILNASINATLLIQPPPPGWTYLINPAAIVISGLVGGFLATWGIAIQRKHELEDRRIQANSELKGHYTLQSNLYYSLGHANIDAEVSKDSLIKHFGGIIDRRLDFQQINQYQEAQKLANELRLELARSNKDLYETIGRIEVLFPKTDELTTKVSVVEGLQFRFHEVIKPPEGSMDVNEWKKAKDIELRSFLDDILAPAFDSLLDYLKPKLEEIGAKRWWQFWR